MPPNIRQLAMAGHGANLRITAESSSGDEVTLTGIDGRPGWFSAVDNGYRFMTNIEDWSSSGPRLIFQGPNGKKYYVSTTSSRNVRVTENSRPATINTNNTGGGTPGPSGSAAPSQPAPPTTYRVTTWREGASVCFTNPTTNKVKKTAVRDWQLSGALYWYARRYYTDSI